MHFSNASFTSFILPNLLRTVPLPYFLMENKGEQREVRLWSLEKNFPFIFYDLSMTNYPSNTFSFNLTIESIEIEQDDIRTLH